MRRRTAVALCCLGLLSIPAFAQDDAKVPACCKKGAHKAATDTAEKPGRMRCSLTGKVVDKCCCEQREGQTYCPLAKKNVEKCCCTPVANEKVDKTASK